jgi:hypothetical protein
LASDGRSIGLLWTSTVIFQKLQRFVHGDSTLAEYVEYISAFRNKTGRTLCLYSSDAEVFDFRPGRYRGEEKLSQNSEWARTAKALSVLSATKGLKLVKPSAALKCSKGQHVGRMLRLENAAYPVPVKKQPNYNLTRWAVTGRDDVAVNAANAYMNGL